MSKRLVLLFLQSYRNFFTKRQRLKIKKLFKFIYYKFRFIKLKIHLVFSNSFVNIIIGAALTKQKGWFSTNEDWLDITRKEHWDRLFGSKRKIKRVLAEHVFEHLTIDEMRISLKLIYENMIDGGSLRIAVPDGNNPNKEYRDNCGINGFGADASDHKQFITFEFLSKEVEKVGFSFFLIEGYLKNKELILKKPDDDLGRVMRSRSSRKIDNDRHGWDFVDSNTSLILDCFKIVN